MLNEVVNESYVKLFHNSDGSYDSVLASLLMHKTNVLYMNEYFSFVIHDLFLDTVFVNITDREDLDSVLELIPQDALHYAGYGEIAREVLTDIVPKDFKFQMCNTFRINTSNVKVKSIKPRKISMDEVTNIKSVYGDSYTLDNLYEIVSLGNFYLFAANDKSYEFYLGIHIDGSFGFYKSNGEPTYESVLEAVKFLADNCNVKIAYTQEFVQGTSDVKTYLQNLGSVPGQEICYWFFKEAY